GSEDAARGVPEGRGTRARLDVDLSAMPRRAARPGRAWPVSADAHPRRRGRTFGRERALRSVRPPPLAPPGRSRIPPRAPPNRTTTRAAPRDGRRRTTRPFARRVRATRPRT